MSRKRPGKQEYKKIKHLTTPEDIKALLPYAHPLSWYKPGRLITVNNKMQQNSYRYMLSAKPGKSFAAGFKPQLSPAKMLQMGVFEGKYLNDCIFEFPREWYKKALRANKLSPNTPNIMVNEFQIKSRLSLRKWKQNGWIPITNGDNDDRGWFQWYCRYWIGRRDANVDAIQIARWRAFTRHKGQILASYVRLGPKKPKTRAQKRLHRPRQRQALLQWAYRPYA
jgi:hypothetical protein